MALIGVRINHREICGKIHRDTAAGSRVHSGKGSPWLLSSDWTLLGFTTEK